MHAQQDAIQDIGPNRIRFFGGPGKMLLPSPGTVARLLESIPQGQLITTTLIGQRLAAQFGVRGTCPVTTRKALQQIAGDPGWHQSAYWRVIKPNGELIAAFPGGLEGQAVRLEAEGFVVSSEGKTPRVVGFKDHLVRFGN